MALSLVSSLHDRFSRGGFIMSCYRNIAIASAIAFAVSCGNAPDGERQGGGGADGFGDDARPTAAERTGATGDSGRGMADLSETERAFVEKASMSNQMEVTLGNLAEDKAENEEVKRFAEQLVQDHQKANRDLQSSLGGDAIPAQQPSGAPDRPGAAKESAASGTEAEMRRQAEQTEERLEGASGEAFDRAYLAEMVKHHEKDVQEFERAAQSDNPQVRSFAERTLPTLRNHLQQARQLQQSIR
jgi:putative membrane protein